MALKCRLWRSYNRKSRAQKELRRMRARGRHVRLKRYPIYGRHSVWAVMWCRKQAA